MDNYVSFVDNYLDNILAIGAILFCGIIVCGIICIPYYFFKKSQKKHLLLMNNGKREKATIVAVYQKHKVMRGDDNTPSFWYEVDYAKYSFEVNGRTFTGDFAQSKKQFYKVGDEIEAFYDVNNPNINCTHRQIDEDNKTNRLFVFLLSFMILVTLIFTIGMGLSL